jgi:predicted kinase
MKDIISELKSINEYIDSIKESIQKELVNEGVYDPGILKCIFMAGGPGSGKSFTAQELFGIDKKLRTSFSRFGLKIVNSDSAFEAGLRKNGINPKFLADIEKENPDFYNNVILGDIRQKAKQITKAQKTFFEEGRLGMIVDGTGDDYSKISSQKKKAEELGYDCYMVFVNTSLEVALERNKRRDRTLPDNIVQEIWKACQENMGKFQNTFGASNFRIVDNTVYKPIDSHIQKAVNQFINSPIKNPIGKKWVEYAKLIKKSNA